MLAAAALLLAACTTVQPHKDTSLTPEARARDLVSRLTLEEKVSLMRHESAAIPRLDVEQYNWWSEALHGVARAGLATVFPQPIGMAASFDNALLYDVFTAASDEARAKHHLAKSQGPLKMYQGLTFWTPNVNIFRDPRWGRGHETYGEDPYLTSVMGLSVVRGLQGDNFQGGLYTGPDAPKYYKLHACAKHYAVHSGPEWSRHTYDAKDIPARDLWETYLPAFKSMVIDGGVKEVMCAYNRYEGEPCCGSNRLLQVILRDGWGYDGIVTSDCWAVNDFYNEGAHHTEPTAQHAVAKAVISGTDLECGHSYQNLVDAVEQGLIDEATIDQSLIRLMTARYQLGEMDDDSMVPWASIPYSVVASPENRQLAAKMARESIVLLKNDGILPLSRDMKIGIIGPNANDSLMQWGNYNGFPLSTSTLLSAMQARLPEAQIVFVDGIDHASSTKLQSLYGQANANGKKGFEAKYWNRYIKKAEEAQELQPEVNFHYDNPLALTTAGATVWAPGVSISDFTGLFSSKLTAESAEPIVFSLQAQGYAMLYIDGERVFSGGNMKLANAYTLMPEPGHTYDISIFFQATEGDCSSLYFDFGHPLPLDVDNYVAQLADCDAIIFAGGLSPQLEGEEMPVHIPGFRGGDRETIELPAVQTQVVDALHRAGKKVVFVNFSGSAVALVDESKMSSAVVQAWYPGEAGGEAVADVLFGDYNPAGRLPITFYRSTADLPDIEDYSMANRTYRYFKGKPLYPFGHGLSYSTFAYGDATVAADGENYKLSIDVTNTSERQGEEVVQVYLSRPDDKQGPARQLRAFKRISIEPGQTANVVFDLEPQQFAWFNPEIDDVEPMAGQFVISYGPSSDPATLKSITINR